MPRLPSFVKPGASGLDDLATSKFIKLVAGKPVEFVCLTGIEPPEGEEPNGSNSVLSYNEFTMWMDDLAEGKRSPRFPALGGPSDPGVLLGLTPRFRMMLLVIEKDSEDEKILSATVSIFKQLVEIEQAFGHSLRGHILRVTKTGEGLKTKYRVIPTGKAVDIEGEPTTNLIDFLGPTTRAEIVDLLTEAGVWPPTGGDPYAEGLTTKVGAKKKSPAKSADDEMEVPEDE